MARGSSDQGHGLALKRLLRAIERNEQYLLITRLPRKTTSFNVDVSYVSMGDTEHLLEEAQLLRRKIKREKGRY